MAGILMTCPAHSLAASRRFLDWEDVDLIKDITAKLPKRRQVLVVDLGVGSGTTALSVFAERKQAIRVISIDHSEDAIKWSKDAMVNARVNDIWEGRLSDSVEAAGQFEDAAVDLLLLDTSHTLKDTKRELAAWLPKLKAGGFLWAHDYRNEEGVSKSINKMLREGVLVKLDVRGLGIACSRQ